MNRQSIYSARLGVLVLATVFAMAGCNSATREPTVTEAGSTPTPTTAPTATPTAAPSATAAPAASATAAPATAVPSATAAPEASATAAPAATPTPGPSGPAGACSGGASVQQLFTSTASTASFTVYCGVVGTPWFFDSGSYGAQGLDITYCTQTNSGHTCPSGPKIEIREGPLPVYVSDATSVGPAKFGDLDGTLYSVSGGDFLISVAPGTAKSYLAIGSGGVSQATFVNIVKALVKVPKS